MSRSSKRVLVVGLDGYDPQLAARFMADGGLPHLQALTAHSAVVPLEHGAARRTGLAWEHFASGMNPEAAGRYSAVDFNAQSYRCNQRGTHLTPFTTALGDAAVIFDAPYFDLARSGGGRGLVQLGSPRPRRR